MKRASCLASRHFKNLCNHTSGIKAKHPYIYPIQRLHQNWNRNLSYNNPSVSRHKNLKAHFTRKNLSLKHYLTGAGFFGTMASNSEAAKNENESKVNSTSNIVVSKSDERKYRCITLPNKMDIFLVSDPSTEKYVVSFCYLLLLLLLMMMISNC